MTQLSEIEALRAVSLFLEQFYLRAGDGLATLIADITIDTDGGTMDPAAWDDWLRVVVQMKGAQPRA